VFASVKNEDVKLFFELIDLHAERRLGDEATLRGFGKVTVSVNGEYVLQLGQSHERLMA
jgi:hypothetical protein